VYHAHSVAKLWLIFVSRFRILQKEFIRNAINDAVNENVQIPLPVENDLLNTDEFVSGIQLPLGNSTVEQVDPIPARQVLSLRGVRSKPPIVSATSEETQSSDGTNAEKLHILELNIIARLFFKLITTFKHS